MENSSARSNTATYQRAGLWLLLAYLLVCLSTIPIWLHTAQKTALENATRAATQHTLWHKERLAAMVRHELDLTRLMAESPLIKAWMVDENNPILAKQAMEHLDSFRAMSVGGIWSAGVEKTLSYYFQDGSRTGAERSHVMDPKQKNDAWYFETRAGRMEYSLNVGLNSQGRTRINLWINVPVKQEDKLLGILTAAMPLDQLLESFLSSPQPGVSSFVVDADGTVRAHPKMGLIDYETIAKPKAGRNHVDQILQSAEDQQAFMQALRALRATENKVETLSFDIAGHRQLAAITYLEAIDWYDVVLFDMDAITGSAQSRASSIVALSIMLLLPALLGWLLYRHIISPVIQMTQALGAIQHAPHAVEQAKERGETVPSTHIEPTSSKLTDEHN